MSKSFVPMSYKSVLNIYDTQNAIELTKRTFESKISALLNLKRISAPLFVDAASGLNDNLNGTERPVTFDIMETKSNAQIVHSLAKWKRLALYKYGFTPAEGLYTNMNAIRRDEEMDNIHSIYVDQWDWEKVITRDMRNIKYLKNSVKDIVSAICDTQDTIKNRYPSLKGSISREVSFITTQELEDMYPTLTPKMREKEYVKKNKTVFIMQIGGKLKSGIKHDGRAPDYDDWNLNGDILVWNDILGDALELSSMGIRVDSVSLDNQLKISGCDDRRTLPFHKMLLDGTLPPTIGGGIGQSRLCMLLLEKAHIGEVQVSIWDNDTIDILNRAGIDLL